MALAGLEVFLSGYSRPVFLFLHFLKHEETQ